MPLVRGQVERMVALRVSEDALRIAALLNRLEVIHELPPQHDHSLIACA